MASLQSQTQPAVLLPGNIVLKAIYSVCSKNLSLFHWIWSPEFPKSSYLSSPVIIILMGSQGSVLVLLPCSKASLMAHLVVIRGYYKTKKILKWGTCKMFWLKWYVSNKNLIIFKLFIYFAREWVRASVWGPIRMTGSASFLAGGVPQAVLTPISPAATWIERTMHLLMGAGRLETPRHWGTQCK